VLIPIVALVIAGLVAATAHAVYRAPQEQKATIGIVVVVLAAAGAGVGVAITKSGSDERTFYPIAAAIGGAMVAFMWISHKQKSWPKKGAPKA
jgi:hypothetical protein